MVSDAQKRATKKYQAANYDRTVILLKSGGREELKQFAKQREKSLNSYIIRALRYALADDGADAETIRKICGD